MIPNSQKVSHRRSEAFMTRLCRKTPSSRRAAPSLLPRYIAYCESVQRSTFTWPFYVKHQPDNNLSRGVPQFQGLTVRYLTYQSNLATVVFDSSGVLPTTERSVVSWTDILATVSETLEQETYMVKRGGMQVSRVELFSRPTLLTLKKGTIALENNVTHSPDRVALHSSSMHEWQAGVYSCLVDTDI